MGGGRQSLIKEIPNQRWPVRGAAINRLLENDNNGSTEPKSGSPRPIRTADRPNISMVHDSSIVFFCVRWLQNEGEVAGVILFLCVIHISF